MAKKATTEKKTATKKAVAKVRKEVDGDANASGFVPADLPEDLMQDGNPEMEIKPAVMPEAIESEEPAVCSPPEEPTKAPGPIVAIGKAHVSSKFINAIAMNLGAYNKHRGWDIPKNEDPLTEGYMVQYEDGYISWSPKKSFEESSRPTTAMTFGLAVECLKRGMKVAREGWDGKRMFVFMVDGSKFKVNRKPLNEILEEGTEVEYRPHIDLKAADGTVGVWNPNMMDILGEDWVIVK